MRYTTSEVMPHVVGEILICSLHDIVKVVSVGVPIPKLGNQDNGGGSVVASQSLFVDMERIS